MQETIISDASEALRQDMLKAEPEEVGAGYGASAHAASAGFEIFESDQAVLIGDDVLLADDAAIEIDREVLQGRLSTPDMLDINDPVGRHRAGYVEACVVERGEEACAEDFAERLLIEQIFVLDLKPLSPCALYAAAGNDDMQVGMEIEASGMGMKDGGHGDVGTEEPGLESEVF